MAVGKVSDVDFETEVLKASGPVVVDVNSFPGYAGVPGAAKVIADYIDGYAHGRHSLPAGRRPAGRLAG